MAQRGPLLDGAIWSRRRGIEAALIAIYDLALLSDSDLEPVRLRAKALLAQLRRVTAELRAEQWKADEARYPAPPPPLPRADLVRAAKAMGIDPAKLTRETGKGKRRRSHDDDRNRGAQQRVNAEIDADLERSVSTERGNERWALRDQHVEVAKDAAFRPMPAATAGTHDERATGSDRLQARGKADPIAPVQQEQPNIPRE